MTETYANARVLHEARVRREVAASLSGDDAVETSLQTDARVLARVTDGIYRRPGSALRELLANAYDADATEVTIQTDRPRFRRITVSDNGHGMTSEALVHLIHHIGGSAKRTALGAELGITSASDPRLSPGGRRLIGKIGIGLFSVAQLTAEFQIITKAPGERHRTIATVLMQHYSDQVHDASDPNAVYEAGKVLIWREPAEDVDTSGTTLVLDAIYPQSRDTLRSWPAWEAVTSSREEGRLRIDPPKYHIGVVDPKRQDILQRIGATTEQQALESLPWEAPPRVGEEPFHATVEAVWDALYKGDANPRLETLYDYYFGMVWQLALALPLRYIDKHPFMVNAGDDVLVYDLTQTPSRAIQVKLRDGETVRERLQLGDAVADTTDFSILFDEMELSRPVRVTGLPITSNALTKPMLFFGRHREEFEGVDSEISGGPLAFQAYIEWAPKIAPGEHQGVLIRIQEASGTLYDSTFMQFPVAEQRRLSQITCEVFVTEGMDGALNIDRESFNFAHPHVVALTRWLHRALRTVIAEQKRLGAEVRARRRESAQASAVNEARRAVGDLWRTQSEGDDSEPPAVAFLDPADVNSSITPGTFTFRRERVVGDIAGANWELRRQTLEDQLTSVAQALSAFDLLDDLSLEERERLFATLRLIIQAYQS